MRVRSLGWLGIKTPKSAAMTALYRDVLQLAPIDPAASGARFRLDDGTEVHVYDESDPHHDFFGAGPVVGLEVDDFHTARERLLAHGIEFIYPEPQRAAGKIWQHFRAPDGNVYELIGDSDE